MKIWSELSLDSGFCLHNNEYFVIYFNNCYTYITTFPKTTATFKNTTADYLKKKPNNPNKTNILHIPKAVEMTDLHYCAFWIPASK